jgi:hypothetical protein
VVQPSTLIPFILASFFFVARVIAKSSGLAGGWGWDDYTIIVSYVSLLPIMPCALLTDLQILGVVIYVLNIYSEQLLAIIIFRKLC